MEPNYYMVRAMHSQKEEIDLFLTKGVVAVGWSSIDFSSYDSSEYDKLLEKIRNRGGNRTPSALGRKLGEVQRFLGIQRGDVIVVPRPGCISIAEVTGDHIYDEEAKCLDLANQVQVTFDSNDGEIVAIPRAELQEKFQRTLGARGFCILNLNAYKEEIDYLRKRKQEIIPRSILAEKEEKYQEQFKAELLKRLQAGKTHIKSHGTGFEELLKELLECEGYQAFIPSKRNSTGIGDIDIKAQKDDRFCSTTLLIQAKHHEGKSGVHGVKQLKEAVRQLKEDAELYNEPVCWFITTADSVSDEAQREADEAGIFVMTGSDFVDWLYDRIDDISDETRMKLGISKTPYLL